MLSIKCHYAANSTGQWTQVTVRCTSLVSSHQSTFLQCLRKILAVVLTAGYNFVTV